jgi:hypothetical protein
MTLRRKWRWHTTRYEDGCVAIEAGPLFIWLQGGGHRD